MCWGPIQLLAAVMAIALVLPPKPSDPSWNDPIVRAAFESTANDCEGPRKPFVERVDINKDGSADAIVWDRAECYRSVGGYFALVTRRGGKWVNIGHGDGRPRWLRSRNHGWPDFEARELHYGAACFRFYQFTGEKYWPNYLKETEPRHCRNQRHDHGKPLSPEKDRH